MDDVFAWALDSGTAAAAKAAVKAGVLGVLALGGYLLTRSLKARGEVRIGAGEGVTRQSPQVLVLALMCGALASAFLLWGVLDPSSLDEAGAGLAWLLLIVGFTAGFVATAIYAQHRWTWDADRLEWRGAFRRIAISWRDLQRTGRAWDGQFFVRDVHGRTVRWTTYALEHEALSRAVEENLARNRAGEARAGSARGGS